MMSAGRNLKTAKPRFRRWRRNDFELFIFALLGIVFLGFFAYAPMYGIVLAFKDGDGYLDIMRALNSEWYGLGNFKEFITDPDFGNIMLNTLGLNLLQLAINFPAPIIFAILMNEIISPRFKKGVQAVTFFPHFISWVIFGGIFISLLDFDTGVLNLVLKGMGLEPVNVLGGKEYFWGLIIITSILKGLGWGSVIYVAAIAGINPEMYEAARIDGANRLHKIVYIVIPSLAPTITLFFILSVSGLLNNGFDHIYVFQNVNNIDRSEVLDTFIFKRGLTEWRYSYTTALGFFKAAISFVLLLVSNFVCRKINGKGIFA